MVGCFPTEGKAWEKESTRITYHFRIDWAKAREIDSEEEWGLRVKVIKKVGRLIKNLFLIIVD